MAQLESLKTTLAGALRREQMAETSIRKLEAEIELLNRLVCPLLGILAIGVLYFNFESSLLSQSIVTQVHQREEDTMRGKMMLRFRDDKIRRLESRIAGSITADEFLQEDNKALSDENQLLQGKIDQNPEVTRFAKENIRLQEQLRRSYIFFT